MFVVSVTVLVKPENVDAFITATMDNARNTRKEPGNVRFDVLRLVDQPLKFALYEVYRDEAAFKAHQQTEHYARWKREIEDHCAVPRSSDKFTTLFPNPYV